MKVISKISLSLLVLAIGFSSCKKCSQCTSEASKNYQWKEGDVLTVSSGIVTYKDVEYLKGQSFTISKDTTVFADGMQFEGEGMVFINSEFCEKGRIYDNMIFEYERNGWTCSEVKKKDVAKENQ